MIYVWRMGDIRTCSMKEDGLCRNVAQCQLNNYLAIASNAV